MAAITAPTQNSKAPMPPLWQAPVFVLGIAAFLAVWFGRPLWPECAARRVEIDLEAARQLLARQNEDGQQALKHAQAAQEACDLLPERYGEATFLVGSAYVRLAELTDPRGNGDLWRRAKQALEAALQAGVSDEDKPDLDYRLAKIALFLGEPLPAVIERLEETVPHCSTRVEGHRLLSEAYLRLPKPDLVKALEANHKLRDVPEATAAELSLAKLQGGEILLQMGKPAEARSSLEMIGEQAAPAILMRARLLCGQSYQEERKWGDAIREYHAVLADTRAPVSNPSLVYYNLGLCYQRLDQPQEALKAWQECMRLSRGGEGAAAALVLAELRLHEHAFESAQEMLVKSVARVNKPNDWKNPLIDARKAREVFERALKVFREVSRHDLALRVLDSYAKLTIPRRILALRGEIASEWARLKLDDGPRTPDLERQAEELFRLAGESFTKCSELKDLPVTEQGELLWQAAKNFVDARDEARAQKSLEQVVALNLEPARLGEAWHLLAASYRAAGKSDLALKAWEKCMEYDTPFAHRARHALAMSHLEKGNLDEAEAMLIFNLKLLRWESSDQEAMRESLFTLANLLFQRRDYRRVARYLEDTIGRFKDHPDVTRARYQLAESYRRIASQAELNRHVNSGLSPQAQAHFQTEHVRWLRKAADEFATLTQILETSQGKEHLPSTLREEVPFLAAECLHDAGQYERSLVILEQLIERHAGQPQALRAAGKAVSCYAELREVDKVRQRLLQIKLMLTQMPQLPEDVRQAWEEWLAMANRLQNES